MRGPVTILRICLPVDEPAWPWGSKLKRDRKLSSNYYKLAFRWHDLDQKDQTQLIKQTEHANYADPTGLTGLTNIWSLQGVQGPSGQHKVKGLLPEYTSRVRNLKTQIRGLQKNSQLMGRTNGRKQIFACPFRCSKEVEDRSMTQWTNTVTSRYASTSKKSLKIPILEICHFYGTKFWPLDIFTKKCIDLWEKLCCNKTP